MSHTIYKQIGRELALASKAVGQAMGTTVNFSHRGGGELVLSVVVRDEELGVIQEPGEIREEQTILIDIPAEELFKAVDVEDDRDPITAGDRIEWDGRRYYVADPIAKVSNGFIYRVRATRVRRQASGL